MIPFRKRIPRWFTLLFSFALLAVVCSGIQAEKSPLTVYFLDVGQGDSTVISSPAGKVAIIDGGMGGDQYKKKDKAKTVIIPFLKSKGIKKLDAVIMTHADIDHIGGFVYLLENTKAGSEYPLEINEFFDPGQPHTTYLYQDLLKSVKKRPEVKYRIAKRGDLIDLGEGVRAEMVAPDHIYEDPNNSSIVLKLTYGKISLLLTGDAEAESEKAMVKKYGDALKSTVLKAGHHGSANSSNDDFLKRVKPEVVVISVGEKNKFKLPFKEAMQRLEATGAKIYRTDYQGMITISTDGETYKVTTEKEAPPPEKKWDFQKVLKEEEKININTASEDELETLPRIGKIKAHDIMIRRPYASIDDLRRVPGIGAKIMERLRPLITVGRPGKGAAPAHEGTPINSISPKDVGKKIPTLTGEIRAVKVFRDEKGRTLMLRDSTGTIDVLIWKDLYESIPQREKLAEGTRIQVRGEIGSHEGKLQIKPSVPGDIRIVEEEKTEKPAGKSATATPAAPVPTAPPTLKRAA
ncbi:MAG: MBL fold metallo-hydrolase [Candidatus Aureabacteria bacterium]|nr:MBL fold metallo-hydrolase [Candidatus Auribacterota bacterium]